MVVIVQERMISGFIQVFYSLDMSIYYILYYNFIIIIIIIVIYHYISEQIHKIILILSEKSLKK